MKINDVLGRDGQVAVWGEVVLGLDAWGPVEVHSCLTKTLHCNVDILKRKTLIHVQILIFWDFLAK